MSGGEVLDIIIDLKKNSIRIQEYEVASSLRDIELAFTGKNDKYIEPTYDNLKAELERVVLSFEKDPWVYVSIRDIKLMLLLD